MNELKITLPGEDNFFIQEAYKTLRTNLQFCGQDVKVICFTSCDENEGKSIVTLSVGKDLANMGKRVLVIDADMRKSVMAGRNLHMEDTRGLSEVLIGMYPLKECLHTAEGGLQVLSAGKCPPNPVDLLCSKSFAELIGACRDTYDYVLVDTPPLGVVVDAAVVCTVCDGAVLVIGKPTPRAVAQTVLEQIRKSGCAVLGVVCNMLRKDGRKREATMGGPMKKHKFLPWRK